MCGAVHEPLLEHHQLPDYPAVTGGGLQGVDDTVRQQVAPAQRGQAVEGQCTHVGRGL